MIEEPTFVESLKNRGFHTACIGGVSFVNKQTALSRVFPEMFNESHWETQFGVTEPKSTQFQLEKAKEIIKNCPKKRLMLFVNVSAMHQPNCFYLKDDAADSLETHKAAMRYVDSQLPLLMETFSGRPALFLFMGCHGTTYGESGYTGHRLAQKAVWTVPYAEYLKTTS